MGVRVPLPVPWDRRGFSCSLSGIDNQLGEQFTPDVGARHAPVPSAGPVRAYGLGGGIGRHSRIHTPALMVLSRVALLGARSNRAPVPGLEKTICGSSLFVVQSNDGKNNCSFIGYLLLRRLHVHVCGGDVNWACRL